ncbi:hypothetical protein [Sphaerisporangium rhizosphaerae]|uniref:Uncharacterized protein n=1 Tax=Sphaerisporangium rhizosphaerae TaxID=2269375 RepID=A0ABW2PCU1_9ACTN
MNSGMQSYVEWMVRARWGQVPTTPDALAGPPSTRPPHGDQDHRPGDPARADDDPALTTGRPPLANGDPTRANGDPGLANGASALAKGDPAVANGEPGHGRGGRRTRVPRLASLLGRRRGGSLVGRGEPGFPPPLD